MGEEFLHLLAGDGEETRAWEVLTTGFNAGEC